MATTQAKPVAPPLELLVLQPTPFCNINCSYCYLPERDNRDRMSQETLRNAIAWLQSFGAVGDKLSIAWHAGEPLVLPISYYADAFTTISNALPNQVKVEHSIQSNATLVTENWCNFIKDRGIRLGVSIDGPAHINDLFRLTRSGRGTFDQAMAGIRLLQKHAVDFHVITVLTNESLKRPDELFDFFFENDIRRIGFNIEEIEAENKKSSLQSPDIEEAYKSFMERFLLLAKNSNGAVDVREFAQMSHVLMTPSGKGIRNQQTTPFSIISVDCYGNLSTFSPELLGTSGGAFAWFNFANVNRDKADAVWSNENFVAVAGDIAKGVEMCRSSCEYYELCGGGAPANKLFENGTFASSETLYCRLKTKAIVDIVLADLERQVGAEGEEKRIRLNR